MPENHIVIFCTVPDRESGEKIARSLVEERLAPGVNLLPVLSSIYRWQGEIHEESECLLLIETSAARYPALAERLRALHPYEVPKIIAVPIAHGDPAYLNWITENVS